MLASLAHAHTAFASPAGLTMHAPASVRTSAPLMAGGRPTRKERKGAANVDGASLPADVEGVVVPADVVAPAGNVAEVAPAESDFKSKLPPLSGSRKAEVVSAFARTAWNPNGLDVSMLPGPLKAQFVPSYLKTAPAYLDGSLPGDVGFDPWGLVSLASPTAATDKFARSAADRDAKMLAMAPEEQAQALAWMRESELKHCRLAMLAAAGWPLAELYSAGERLQKLTNGRAPSLFNGHLLDFLPFLIVVFGPIAYLEFQNKDRLPDGDYGFDPMGLAGPQRPYGAFPFDAFLGKQTPIDALPNAKDLPAMRLAEIKNGRLAMMAITGMAVQEFVWGVPVVQQTPFFFGR